MIEITQEIMRLYMQHNKHIDPQINEYIELYEKSKTCKLSDQKQKRLEGCLRAIRYNSYYWLEIYMLNENDNIEEFDYENDN